MWNDWAVHLQIYVPGIVRWRKRQDTIRQRHMQRSQGPCTCLGQQHLSCVSVHCRSTPPDAARPSPAVSTAGRPHLTQPGPRPLCQLQVDPRIHFALVCGAKSCPPIKLYTPDNLDEGLTAAGEAFCASEVSVDKRARAVTLSKIFKGRGDAGRRICAMTVLMIFEVGDAYCWWLSAAVLPHPDVSGQLHPRCKGKGGGEWRTACEWTAAPQMQGQGRWGMAKSM
eukprot:365010-Chlamydomonas_euryale.AAC.3